MVVLLFVIWYLVECLEFDDVVVISWVSYGIWDKLVDVGGCIGGKLIE